VGEDEKLSLLLNSNVIAQSVYQIDINIERAYPSALGTFQHTEMNSVIKGYVKGCWA